MASLPENLPELAQGFYDVVGIHRGPFEHVYDVDDSLGIEECQHLLFVPAGLELGLDGAGMVLWQPLL